MNYKMINKYFAYLNKYENLYKYMKFNICCKFLNEINIDTFRNTFSIFLTLIIKKLIKEKNQNLNDIIYYLLKDDNNEKIRLEVLKTLKNELKIIKEADSNIDYQFMINLSFLISKNIEIKFLIIDIFQLLYFKYYNKLREIFIKKENPFKSLFYKIITNFFLFIVIIDNKTVTSTLQESMARYDKGGEMHYDIISAFIKSVRGSDPNAALFYLARMLDAGEDPLFIARRLCLSATEDVGLANPNAMLLANACFQIVHEIGMPEARIPLAECTVYLASSRKSNASYMALERAFQAVREHPDAQVPMYLRNAPTKLMEELGYSDGYKYAHDYKGNFVDLEFMPSPLEGTVFYEPGDNRHEDALKAYLQWCWPKYYSK